MAQQIAYFALAWDPQQGCDFRVQPAGESWTSWRQVPAAELAAIAAILNEQPVFIQTIGALTTGLEPVGS
ncbi:hypothetical protein [Paraburkholderia strydomiana]